MSVAVMVRDRSEFTEEWLNTAIGIVAVCIVQDGAVYAPILERLEREMEALRQRDDAVARAHRYAAERGILSIRQEEPV